MHKYLKIIKTDSFYFNITDYNTEDLFLLYSFLTEEADNSFIYTTLISSNVDESISGNLTQVSKESGNIIIRNEWYGCNGEEKKIEDEDLKTILKIEEFAKVLKQWNNICGDYNNLIRPSEWPDEILIEKTGNHVELIPTWYNKKI